MRPRHFLWVIVLGSFGASAGGASSAFAQTPPAGAKAGAAPASATPARSIADTYKEAVAAYQAGDYEKAYRGFKEVWEQEKKPKVAGNLGRTELKLGKYCDAAEHLSLYLRDYPNLSPAMRQETTALVDGARAKVATLRLEVDQPGAEILVDGATVGKAPLGRDLCVEPGKHKIEARLGAFKAAGEQEVEAGATATKKLEFTPPKAVGGGGGPIGGSADPKPSAARVPLLVGGAVVAVVGLGIGIGAGVVSLSKQGEQDKCTGPTGLKCFTDLEPARGTLAATSLAGFVVGGLAATGTLVYYVAGPKSTPGATAVGVRVSPAGPGLVLSGSW